MSSVIDKLKVKPEPKKDKGIDIIIANKKKTEQEVSKGILDRMKFNMSKQDSVDIKSNIDKVDNTRLEIVDKTRDKTFDANKFLSKIKKSRVIQNVTAEEKKISRATFDWKDIAVSIFVVLVVIFIMIWFNGK